jgi:putative ABC transport system substrate-binding protein
VARVGVLIYGTFEARLDELRDGLRELGWVEGRNLVIEARQAEGRQERLAGLAKELVALQVDALVASSTPAIEAARAASATIPIVMATAGDALATGLVTSLARPGGNLTGLSLALVELAGKTVELFRELLPGVTRMACLVDRRDPLHRPFLAEGKAACRRLGLDFLPSVVGSPGELDATVAKLAAERAGAAVVQPILAIDPAGRARLVELTLQHRLPAASGLRRFAEAGGLLAYAAEFKQQGRRVASYVDKLLRGARPGDLPVERPETFLLVINARTARRLGVTVPPDMLARADEVLD